MLYRFKWLKFSTTQSAVYKSCLLLVHNKCLEAFMAIWHCCGIQVSDFTGLCQCFTNYLWLTTSRPPRWHIMQGNNNHCYMYRQGRPCHLIGQRLGKCEPKGKQTLSHIPQPSYLAIYNQSPVLESWNSGPTNKVSLWLSFAIMQIAPLEHSSGGIIRKEDGDQNCNC